MPEKKNPYPLLGVPGDVSEGDLRKAYRRLAREHHPDANHGDPKAEERFKEIQHAYEILSEPGKRRALDASLQRASPQARTGGSRTGGARASGEALRQTPRPVRRKVLPAVAGGPSVISRARTRSASPGSSA